MISLGIVAVVLTFFSLILGELLPRRIASVYPETVAVLMARPLQLLTRSAWPIARFLELCTDALSRLLGRETVSAPPITEEAIKSLVQQGTEAGVFEESEQDMVNAVLQLGDKRARSLMTPRTQIAWLDRDDNIERIRQKIIASGHSCFPVAARSLDKVDGVVHSKDLLAHSLEGRGLNLQAPTHQPLFVPRTITALEVLELFKGSGQHIALVVDEYGVLQGLVTLEDILEEIFGDIAEEHDQHIPEGIRPQADGSLNVDGWTPIRELNREFDWDLPDEEATTIAGLVIHEARVIPEVGQLFSFHGFKFEILRRQRNQIIARRITPTKPEPDDDSG